MNTQVEIGPLYYGCSGNYLQICKAIGKPTLLVTSCFCLKVGMLKMFEFDLYLWPLWPNFEILS